MIRTHSIGLTGAFLYGLGTAGEAGVETVLEWFDEGVRRTLTLVGARSFEELNENWVHWRS